MGYISKNQFARVVKAEMKRNSLSLRRLAEQSGISAGYLSLVLSGERNPPQPDVIDRMTRALNLTPPMLHLLAGYIPRKDRRWDQLFQRLPRMTNDQVDQVIDYIDSLTRKTRR